MSRAAASLIAAAAVLLVAGPAEAGWSPVFTPSYVQVRPGEKVTVSVYASWLSGIWLVPFTPMTFTSEAPAIATVTGYLPTTSAAAVEITGQQPGVTRVGVVERGGGSPFPTAAVIVVAERELPVEIAIDGILFSGHPVTLRAISDEPDATFTWYNGRFNGLYTWLEGTGRELKIVPDYPLVYEYWVLMQSPRGAGAIGITLQVQRPQPRRRAAQH
jgi:hypothetical protein